MTEPRPLIPAVPLAFTLPGPLFQPQQRASDADRDTAVDILCAAVAEGRLTLAELDERVGAALSARTICELAALIADLPGPWTPVPASASVRVPPPASPGWASRAPERWSLLQSLAGRPELPGQPPHGHKVQQRGDMPVRAGPAGPLPDRRMDSSVASPGTGSGCHGAGEYPDSIPAGHRHLRLGQRRRQVPQAASRLPMRCWLRCPGSGTACWQPGPCLPGCLASPACRPGCTAGALPSSGFCDQPPRPSPG